MAEEVLKYKIEIDDADLASQLFNIRDQVNGALMGEGGGFGSGRYIAPLNQLNDSMSKKSVVDYIADLSDKFQQGSGNFSASLSEFREGVEHGMQMFNQTRASLGLTNSPIMDIPYGPTNQYNQLLNNIGERSFFSSVAGAAVGAGYNNDMPMSKGEYRLKSSQGIFSAKGIAEGLLGAGSGAIGLGAGAIAGAAAGSAGGPVGIGVGLAVGLGLDLVGSTLAKNERQAMDMGGAIKALSGSFTGPEFSSSDATSAARSILNTRFDKEPLIKGIDSDEIQRDILGFANAGGYSGTSSPDAFIKTTKDLIKNTKEVMDALRVSRDEAVKFMAGMQGLGISVGQSGDYANTIRGVSIATGSSPERMLNYLQQGSAGLGQMGVDAIPAQSMLLQTRMQAEALKESPLGRETIRRYGGVENASMAMAQQQTQYATTPLGMMAYGGIEAGAFNFNDQFIAFSNKYSDDPTSYFGDLYTAPNRAANINHYAANAARMAPFIEQYTDFGITDENTMKQFMLQSGRFKGGRVEIDAAMEMFKEGPERYLQEVGQFAVEKQQHEILSNKVGIGTGIKADIKSGWHDMTFGITDTVGRRFFGGITRAIKGKLDDVSTSLAGLESVEFNTPKLFLGEDSEELTDIEEDFNKIMESQSSASASRTLQVGKRNTFSAMFAGAYAKTYTGEDAEEQIEAIEEYKRLKEDRSGDDLFIGTRGAAKARRAITGLGASSGALVGFSARDTRAFETGALLKQDPSKQIDYWSIRGYGKYWDELIIEEKRRVKGHMHSEKGNEEFLFMEVINESNQSDTTEEASRTSLAISVLDQRIDDKLGKYDDFSNAFESREIGGDDDFSGLRDILNDMGGEELFMVKDEEGFNMNWWNIDLEAMDKLATDENIGKLTTGQRETYYRQRRALGKFSEKYGKHKDLAKRRSFGHTKLKLDKIKGEMGGGEVTNVLKAFASTGGKFYFDSDNPLSMEDFEGLAELRDSMLSGESTRAELLAKINNPSSKLSDEAKEAALKDFGERTEVQLLSDTYDMWNRLIHPDGGLIVTYNIKHRKDKFK
jgi:hypothetical protein